MLELIFGRHGETDFNKQKKAMGQLDIPLNKNGLIQAQEVADSLGKFKFDAILSSDLARCLTGAKLHAGKYQALEVKPDAVWRERNYGGHAGKRLEELGYASDSQVGDYKHFYECDCPNGENMNSFAQRVVRAIQTAYDSHPNQRAMLHTHGGVISIAINYLLGEEYKFENARVHKNGFVSYLKLERHGENLNVVDSLLNVPCSQLVLYLRHKP